MKLAILTTFAALLLIGTANAGNTPLYATDVVAAAPVTYVGADWGPVPIWRVDLAPYANETIDVAAHSAAEARSLVVNLVARDLGIPVSAPVDPPPVTTTQAAAPTQTTTTSAPAAPASADQPAVTAAQVTAAAQTLATATSVETNNPTLTVALGQQVGLNLNVTKQTSCYLQGRKVACWKLLPALKTGKAKVVKRGKTVLKITVA